MKSNLKQLIKIFHYFNNNNNSNIQPSGSTFYNFIQKTKQFFKKEKEINDQKKNNKQKY